MNKGKKREWVAGGLLFIVFAGLFLYLGKDSKLPLIYPDEAGYLGWARRLAGKTGDGLHYYPGYSVLIAPFFWFSDNIEAVYPWIIRLNALLGAAIPVMLYCLSREWCKRDNIIGRWGISAAVSLYPAVTSYVRLAWCEIFLIVLLLGMTMCVVSLSHCRKKVLPWLLLVFFGVWSVLTHPRGLMFCLGAAVAVIVLLRDKKWFLATGGAVGLLFIGVGAYLMLSHPSHIGVSHLVSQISHLTSLSGMTAFVTTMISQFCYLLWSTYGLAAAAVYYGISSIRKKENGWLLWVMGLSSFFFLWVLSALYMSHHARPDHILYGRYMDVAVPLLLLGTCSHLGKRKIPFVVWLGAAVVIALTGILYAEETANLDSWIIHCTGMFYYRFILRNFRFWWTALFFSLLGFFVWYFGRKRKSMTIFGIFCLFLVQAFWMQTSYFRPESQYKGKALSLAEDFPKNADIYVADGSFSWEYHNYRTQRPDLNMSLEDMGQPYVLSKTLRDNEVLIGIEIGRPVYLYSRTEASKYETTTVDCHTEYHWQKTKDGVQVTVINRGSPWLCFQSVKDLRRSVRLSVRQFDQSETMISDERLDFPENLDTGEEQTFRIALQDHCVYVEIQPVKEFTVWFSELGDTPLVLRKTNGTIEETVGKELQSDHSFCRVEFSHLKSVGDVEDTTYAGNLVGFYENDTGASAVIKNIRMPGGTGVLFLETDETQRNGVSVILNGTVKIPASKYENGTYYFPFENLDEITEVTIESETVNPFDESGLPKWMSFLSLDSNLKPVQFAVHRMEDIMGKSVNNHDYGIALKALEVRVEESE